STVVKLLIKNGMVGSIGNLYDIVKKMCDNHMQLCQSKDILLNPRAPIMKANDADANNNVVAE
ncbi:hypothetical protein RYX36_036100, partial [Vicia faba]